MFPVAVEGSSSTGPPRRQSDMTLCAVILLLYCASHCAGNQVGSVSDETQVTFNQHFIEARWHGVRQSDPVTVTVPAGLSFDEPRTVLRFILESSPRDATVYPSERYYYYYYYYAFALRDRVIKGNLRFVDAEKGVIHVGYFDACDRSATRHASFDASSGVILRYCGESKRVEVSIDGIQRGFTLSTRWSDGAGEVGLLPGEQLISGLLDESGTSFWLIHYRPTKSLYYLLNEAAPSADRLVPVRGTAGRYMVGVESRFTYYSDVPTGRKVLVGVSMDSIRANDYFDGPFDQVPPDLAIREVLQSVYPYVTERGGIDEHGNFVELEHQRVAITPYQVSDTLETLVPTLDAHLRASESGPERWVGLVYESKQDFHRQLAARREALEELGDVPLQVHDVRLSVGWPANHWGPQSRGWPTQHASLLSRSWPANHDPTVSATQRPGR